MKQSTRCLMYAALISSTVLPTLANACSLLPSSIQRRFARTINFDGSAFRDSVQTGPADIKFEVANRHFGSARDRAIYDQRVLVEHVPVVHEQAPPGNVREVILIPCSIVFSKIDTTDARINLLKLRGTRDSIFDGRYFDSRSGLQRDSTGHLSRPHQVYGQLFEVNSLSPSLRRTIGNPKQVVLLWWTHDTMCARTQPLRATEYADSTLVLSLAPRNRGEWIQGIPTFDVGYMSPRFINGRPLYQR